jgi:hypothetical protein
MRIVFCFLLLFFNVKGFTQSFKTGINFGIAATQISGDNLSGFNKNGPLLGGFIYRDFKKSWSYEIGMQYILKGSRKIPNFDIGDYNRYLLRLHYIEMPFLLNYHYKKFTIFAGLSIGGLLHWNVYNEIGEFPESSDEKRPFKRYELSQNSGISYKVADGINICLNLSHSLIPVRKHVSQAVWLLNRGQYNESLCLSVRYKLQKSN